MSYDLYFKPLKKVISQTDFNQHFDGRKNYQIGDSQAVYENNETGVYFSFDFTSEEEFKNDDEGDEYFPISFNINYFRPSYFILEAEPEISALIKALDLVIFDPQTEGMGSGPYSSEGLFAGWNKGNEFGYQSILADPSNRVGFHHLPTATLSTLWRWNYEREELQEKIVEDVYIPSMWLFELDGKPVTVSLWPDGIPISTKKVDYFCIPRKELAPRKLFRKAEDIVWVAWEKASEIFLKHASQSAEGIYTLNYLNAPTDVVKYVQSLSSESPKLTRLAPDSVLDTELFKKYT